MFILAAASFLAGGRFSQRDPAAATGAPVNRILYYACPMHPTLRAAHPGDCATCGMRLDPVYKDEPASASLAWHQDRHAAPLPGSGEIARRVTVREDPRSNTDAHKRASCRACHKWLV